MICTMISPHRSASVCGFLRRAGASRRLRSPPSKTSCPIGARLSDKADTALRHMVGVTAEPLTLYRADGRACEPEEPTRTCAEVCWLRQTIERPTLVSDLSERTLIVKIPLAAARTQIYNSDQQAHKRIVRYAPFALEFGRKRHKPMIYKPRGCFAEKVSNSVRRPIERKRLRLGPSILQRASAQNNIPTPQLWKPISPGLDDRHRLLSIEKLSRTCNVPHVDQSRMVELTHDLAPLARASLLLSV